MCQNYSVNVFNISLLSSQEETAQKVNQITDDENIYVSIIVLQYMYYTLKVRMHCKLIKHTHLYAFFLKE